MKRQRVVITSAAVLFSGLLLAEQSTAQTPRATITPPTVDPRSLNLLTWVRGEVRVRRGSTNSADSLTCGPASSHSSYIYGAFNREEVTLKFSFGTGRLGPNRTGTIGSWAIRRSPANRGATLTGSPVIMNGSFTGGIVNLTDRPISVPLRVAPDHFILIGRTVAGHADGHCFDAAQTKDIRIMGNCNRPQDGIDFTALTGSQIYTRGTFSTVVNVTCSTGLASSVDLSLDD